MIKINSGFNEKTIKVVEHTWMEETRNKLTLVKGDPKAPFSIATTPRCRGGRYSFLWIALLYLWSVPYNASKEVSSTIFESLVWLDLGLNAGLPSHWWTLGSNNPDEDPSWNMSVYDNENFSFQKFK